MFFIIITLIVVCIIWFMSDTNNIGYVPKKPSGGKGSSNTGSKGSSNTGSKGTGSKGTGSKGTGSSNTGSKGTGSKGTGSKGTGSKGTGSKGTGGKGTGGKGSNTGGKGSNTGGKGSSNRSTRKPKPGTNLNARENTLIYKITGDKIPPPTLERLGKALAAYQKYNKSGNANPSSSYADLVANDFLTFVNGKWQSNICPNGRTGKDCAGGGGGGGGGGGSSGGPTINTKLPRNPPPDQQQKVTIGGFTANEAYFQWNNNGVKISKDGNYISAFVNPQSTDGSNESNSTDTHRNELAMRVKKVTDLKEISFNFSASGYNHLGENQGGVIFQFKPTGYGGNDGVRLAIENGKLALGLPKSKDGGDIKVIKDELKYKIIPPTPSLEILKDSYGKEIDINTVKNIGMKIGENNITTLYVNGNAVTTFENPKARDPSNNSENEVNVKFGIEVPGDLDGRFATEYSDISIIKR